jgi:hypothetical protein
MTALMHRLLDAMFGPLVPDDHQWAALSRLDVTDGRH